jgi:alpha-N-arabinofuranosidase
MARLDNARESIMRAIHILACAGLALLARGVAAEAPATAQITLRELASAPRIDPYIYGQFVEHLGRGVYGGIWVGPDSKIPNTRGIRNDVVAALRQIHVPIVRWPGGCFAELYHWRDAVGPRAQRPAGVNAAWGDEPESNAFGSDEFMDFLQQIGAQAFLSVNLASGSPAEAQAWLQYLTAPASAGAGAVRAANGHPQPYTIPFIGIGNETWGCGGNMTADFYSDLYRQYLSVLRPYGTLIASDANSDDYHWTETLLRRALYRHASPPGDTPLAYISKSPQITMMSVHFYAFAGNDWGKKSPAVGFTEGDWARSLARASKMDELVSRHSQILDRYDPEQRIGLAISEWGTWWATEKTRPSNLYQQNTLRDAVIAGLTLNILQNHAGRVRMANIAQMVNVLQAMLLTREDGLLLTPTYHVFDLYQVHQGATQLEARVSASDYVLDDVSLPSISASASRDERGAIHVSLVNLDPRRATSLELRVEGSVVARTATGRVMTAAAMDAHPEFGASDPLAPTVLHDIVIRNGVVRVQLPAKSVAMIELLQ